MNETTGLRRPGYGELRGRAHLPALSPAARPLLRAEEGQAERPEQGKRPCYPSLSPRPKGPSVPASQAGWLRTLLAGACRFHHPGALALSPSPSRPRGGHHTQHVTSPRHTERSGRGGSCARHSPRCSLDEPMASERCHFNPTTPVRQCLGTPRSKRSLRVSGNRLVSYEDDINCGVGLPAHHGSCSLDQRPAGWGRAEPRAVKQGVS